MIDNKTFARESLPVLRQFNFFEVTPLDVFFHDPSKQDTNTVVPQHDGFDGLR